jgi:hypothetical protein
MAMEVALAMMAQALVKEPALRESLYTVIEVSSLVEAVQMAEVAHPPLQLQ